MSRLRRSGGRKTAGTPPNLLDMIPVREADWQVDADDRITLMRARPGRRSRRGFTGWLSSTMGPSRVRLDEVGSFTWRHIDGQTDVRTLCGRLQEEFGDRVEPVHERLGQLIRILRRERLVSYRSPP